MGILKFLVKNALPDTITGKIIGVPLGAAADAAGNKVARTVTNSFIDKSEAKLQNSIDSGDKKLFERPPGTNLLIVAHHVRPEVADFEIYNENKELRYAIKDETHGLGHRLCIYNSDIKRVGAVKKDLIAMRVPHFHEDDPINISVISGDEEIGKVKSAYVPFSLKSKYCFDYNGWYIQGDFANWNYKIFNDNDEEIANIKQQNWYMGTVYVVTYRQKKSEFMILLLVATTEIINNPNSY